MRLLLDTHIAIWAVTDSDRLSDRTRQLIERDDNVPMVSVVSLWEIGIRHVLTNRQHDPMPMSAREAQAQFLEAGFDILPVTAARAAAIDNLPALHGDPFDRMPIAQAISEPIRLLTRDARPSGYGELVMLA